MATISNLSQTLESSSEEIFEYICTACEKDSRATRAEYYCSDCGEYYCTKCFAFHQRFPSLSQHSYLGKSDMKQWGKPTTRNTSLLTEKCGNHNEQIVSMYCRDHGVLCCHVCVALEHRSCVDMHYILEVAKGIDANQETLKLKSQIKKVKSKLVNLQNERKQDACELKQSKQELITSINNFRKCVNERLDILEKKAIADMDALQNEHEMILQTSIKSLENSLVQLEDLQQGIEAYPIEENKAPQVFIDVTKFQQNVSHIEKFVEALGNTPATKKNMFVIDPKLEEFVSSLVTLGEFESDSSRMEDAKNKAQLDKNLYKVQNQRLCPVRINKDKKNCLIYGTCQLPSGKLLLTDSENATLKILDQNYKVIDQCSMPAEPRAVCCIDDQQAAVSLTNRTIQLVALGKKMKLSRSVGLGHGCFGIAYHDGKMYVTDGRSKVHVYTTLGTRLRTFHLDQNSQNMLTFAENVAVSKDGSKVYVADFDKGLITLDEEGMPLSTFSDPELEGASAVCVDDKNQVLVCGLRSHTVLQLDELGQRKLGALLTRSDGLDNPRSLCFDVFRSTLIIANEGKENCNSVCVFDLK